MTTATGPNRKDVEDEDLRWDRGSESGPTMGPLRGVLKLSNRDNIQGVFKSCQQNCQGFVAPPTTSHYSIPTIKWPRYKTHFFLHLFLTKTVMSVANFIPTAPNFGLSLMDPATFFETPCDDLHAMPLMRPNISFLFVGEVLYMRNATSMKSLFYRIILLRLRSSTIL